MADSALTRVAVAVVAAEALLAVVCALVILIRSDDSFATATGITVLMLGLVLGWLALQLQRGADWPRTPALVIQLLAIPVGVGVLKAGTTGAGVAVLVVAAGTVFALVSS